MNYDLIIIGAGPSGLTLAQCLRGTYSKILIIEKEAEIGGLHRVMRVPYEEYQVFTEHSPRIYSNTYKNFQTMLLDMGADFNETFTPYNFSIFEIGGETIFSTLSVSEIAKIGFQYILLVANDKYGMNITIGEFMTDNNFSQKSIDLIDRLTRLTDGAGADKFTLNEFLQIFNQQFLYKLYQPRIPNDEGLFKIWGDFLISNNIEIMLNTSVGKINLDSTTGLAKSVNIVNKDGVVTEIFGDKIVLATPPQSFVGILENSEAIIQNSFENFDVLKKYTENTDYMTYISFTFHWDKKLELPKIYGFPRSEWGIAFIVLSNYMTFNEPISKTVFTCTITFTDVVSSFTGKTANQSTKDEILTESLRQLREAFPNLEPPTLSLLSPEMSYSDGKWQTSGKAFITASNEGFLKFSGTVPNLYNVGTHNGKCKYAFTSMETAVTNAIYLSQKIDPNLKNEYRIQNLFTLRELIIIILILTVLFIL
jgi:hypothetical protein